MSFPHCVPAGLLAKQTAIDETIWADGDDAVSQWEDEGGATTNIWQSVDSESDTDYAVTQNVLISDGNRVLRFFMENPSAEPAGDQNVWAEIRAEYTEELGSFSGTATVTIEIREGTTARATSSALALSTTPTNLTEFMSEAEINAVTDWNNILVQMTFEASGFGVDEEIHFRCYRCKMRFTP